MMRKDTLTRWIVTNAVGLGVAFLAILQTGMFLEFGLEWESHWNWVEQAQGRDALAYFNDLLSMLVGGAILGSAQACVFHSRLISGARWILAATIGFGVVAIIIDWPLTAFGLLGAIPGPVEPIIVTVGGGSFAGIVQYMMLRRQNVNASRWLRLWIAGLGISLVPTGILFISLEVLGVSLNWPLETFLSGLMVGGVAARVSGKVFFEVLSDGTMRENTNEGIA